MSTNILGASGMSLKVRAANPISDEKVEVRNLCAADDLYRNFQVNPVG
ncbi:hypothetical protein [Pseudomonas oryzihabitans]|nr:hypothetical protein [Pseudomonas psychrotolerans]